MKVLVIIYIVILLLFEKNVNSKELYRNADESFSLDFIIIKQLFEKARKVIMNGDFDKGVPVLDPFYFNKELSIATDFLSCEISLNEGSFTGLGDFNVISSNFNRSKISISLDIQFPLLEFDADYYNVFGNIYETFPIKGEGKANFQIKDFKLKTKMFLKQSDDGRSILIDRMENTTFTVTKICSETEFDGVIDDIFNAMIDNLLADYLTKINKLMSPTISAIMPPSLNKYLALYDTWKLISIVLN